MLLESVDGRPHLEQVRPVFKAGKPVFIDKPVAGSLADAIAIYELAKETGTPVLLQLVAALQPGHRGACARIRKVGEVARLRRLRPVLSWSSTIPTCSGTASTASRRCSRSWGPAASRSAGSRPRAPTWSPASGRTAASARSAASARAAPTTAATVFGTKGDRPQRRLRRLQAAGRRDLQVLQDRQAAGDAPRRRSRSSPSWKPPTRASARAAPVTIESVMSKAKEEESQEVRGRLTVGLFDDSSPQASLRACGVPSPTPHARRLACGLENPDG